MLTSGFSNAPISKCLVYGLVASSIAVSIADLKYYFWIEVIPHLWQYKQLWRMLLWQVRPSQSPDSEDQTAARFSR